jgi:hypothetical protein
VPFHPQMALPINVKALKFRRAKDSVLRLVRLDFRSVKRITLDMFLKQGDIDNGATIHNKFGAALSLDEKQGFIEVAYDPYLNFTAQRQRRLSFGLRF